AVLLALEKSRAGEDAPTFVVRITYVQPVDHWNADTRAHLELPALDLPVSRTGVELYHSPRFKVALQPGTFRIESDPGVFAEALRYGYRIGGVSGGFATPPPPPSPPS